MDSRRWEECDDPKEMVKYVREELKVPDHNVRVQYLLTAFEKLRRPNYFAAGSRWDRVELTMADPKPLKHLAPDFVHAVRELFDNPFESHTVRMGWYTPEVRGLIDASVKQTTQTCKECGGVGEESTGRSTIGSQACWGCNGRGWVESPYYRHSNLGILADALEDVGCRDQKILDHLRSPHPHWIGCWAVTILHDFMLSSVAVEDGVDE